MSVAACLLLYSFAVVVLGPGLLTRLTRTGVAPRLGVTVWLVAIGSVVASWAVAAGFLAGELVRDWTQPGDTVVSACFAMLQQSALGRYGVLVQIGLLVLAAMAAAAVGRLAWRLARSLLRARACTHEHARMARLAGRHVAGLEAVVLDAPERAAYCVAGRPHTIVVTSAALDALDEPHLDAVLCHERAHLAGRHHLILAVVRGLAAILPRVELFTTGAAEVARLLEMCADDAAARTHGSRTLLGALLAMSDAAPILRGALGATGVGVLARAQRLAAPPGPAGRMRARLLLTALSALLVVGPLVTVLLTAAGFAMCDPLGG
ncbi:M56 family metallopeptidase [Amycolatopsis tucumanensis]|uniref:M56 family metallopeptidase n=1 Tax=Amycolatopsis tucumanensis TaxID=401106 RepID=A0ABP7JHS7_9PSEU|nr:M56 family metallopeptidase [Amycolatopsis tucumanensis]MCF6425230.1 M56 family metallopeptidase [Amycolatopsis tucumanensis]